MYINITYNIDFKCTLKKKIHVHEAKLLALSFLSCRSSNIECYEVIVFLLSETDEKGKTIIVRYQSFWFLIGNSFRFNKILSSKYSVFYK